MASGSIPGVDSPMGEADMAGFAFKEIYDANIRAGFTPPQALYILVAQVTGNPGIAPGIDSPAPPN